MAFVNEVFDGALALMDEMPGAGDAEEYGKRTPAILNLLAAEFCGMTGGRFSEVEEMEDFLAGMPEGFARSGLCYGLAANLLVDENPVAAAFFQQRYEELRDGFVRRVPAEFEEFGGAYGGCEYGEFARW